ncbi:hypothetical protein ALC62_00267 [Cyphomyrmex costatus]|uniref:Uncharacterized protein n=1 Tax=Cyphomyrmex costatus TaxID=456900 RepID=A0A195D7F8_9HYME|nr:hypothetical protein ALC62_00267 [Cyphomyrmex costatus]
MFDMYELRMSSGIKATIKSRLDAEETRFIVAYRLGSYKGSYGVPTKSSRRQQVLAFGTSGKGRNFGPGRMRPGMYLGLETYLRWSTLSGHGHRSHEDLFVFDIRLCTEIGEKAVSEACTE